MIGPIKIYQQYSSQAAAAWLYNVQSFSCSEDLRGGVPCSGRAGDNVIYTIDKRHVITDRRHTLDMSLLQIIVELFVRPQVRGFHKVTSISRTTTPTSNLSVLISKVVICYLLVLLNIYILDWLYISAITFHCMLINCDRRICIKLHKQ